MQWLNKISLESSLNGRRNLIRIVGHNRFINELLAHCLEGNTALHCRRTSCDAPPESDPDILPETCLVIIDSMDMDLASHWDWIMDFSQAPSRKSLCALFNVAPEAEIDAEALRRGIRGLFYRNDAPAAICKGIRKILDGEIWYRRETLYNCIVGGLSDKVTNRQEETAGIRLTVREKLILRHLSRGASNQDIADQMVVSIHTVKSHLYKIYKKINVPNRFQATLWVSNNLDRT